MNARRARVLRSAGWLALVACMLAGPPLQAAEPARPLFESEAELAVTLEADWRAILRDREDPRRHAAVLAYTDASGVAHRIPATVQAPGGDPPAHVPVPAAPDPL